MVKLQPYFEQFHDKIRLKPFVENQDLRDKRDMLIAELRAGLPASAPTFRCFNQGGYAYNTGTIPKDGNFDIDVGVVFACGREAYPNPVDLKKLVRDAISHPGRTVRIRNPCVTVEYLRDGEVDYHVDLAIYVERGDGSGLDLAVGREGADAAHRHWELSDPEGLVAAINNRFGGDDARQMRHCIRYLKRWRDHRFIAGSGPISCALTVAAHNWFAPQRDFFTKTGDDAKALQLLVQAMLDHFQLVMNAQGQWVRRLKITTPVAPYDDLLAKLTDNQMAAVETKLEALRDALKQAADADTAHDACKLLVTQFGGEFPLPPASGTAKKVEAPYINTGHSA
jgi:hypothetical protein